MEPKLLSVLPSDITRQLSASPRKHRERPWTSFLVMVLFILVLLGLSCKSLYHSSNSQYFDDRLLRPSRQQRLGGGSSGDSNAEMCKGRRLYIYNLPREFNEDLVDRCGRLTKDWAPLCGSLENAGYGPEVPRSANGSETLEPAGAWYRTEQFALELLFHERLKRYECATQAAARADAFYIPYYGAMDTAFTLFAPQLHVRDELGQRLAGWLSGSRAWAAYGRSRPHFMVLGRIAWDFSRPLASVEGWGSSLLSLGPLANVTALLIERKGPFPPAREIAVPYPTSFHPSSDHDMRLWQGKVVEQEERRWMCSFIGSSSRGTPASKALRAELGRQCQNSSHGSCMEVRCGGGGAATIDCVKSPEQVIALFGSSTFCLQPTGDSPTRKGLFDSLLAGCIPVLFSELSAYAQYTWHLPANGSLYSVYYDGADVAGGKVDVMASLAAIARDRSRVRRMREAIGALLPRIVYSQPTADHRRHVTFRDAVDVALDHIFAAPSSPPVAL